MADDRVVIERAGYSVPWFGLIFFLFLSLKLSGIITWSWWWVTSPLWFPFVFAAALLALVGIIAGIGFGIAHLIDLYTERKRRKLRAKVTARLKKD